MSHVNITLALVLVMLGNLANAQHVKLSGNVKDKNGALPAITVSLLSATDSAWINTELTDDEGVFVFNEVHAGQYILNVQVLGFDKVWQQLKVTDGIKPIDIVLTASTTELREVVVTSKAPAIQTSLGKTTMNFEQTNVGAGSNVLDLLRKAPGVIVDGKGNVSMGGKGVLILVDDKQLYLTGEDLSNYLRSLSAEQVAQLDLMNQPSAKYDAEGNSGIINIKISRSKKAGLNGNVAVAYGQGEYWNTHNSANVNYKKDKLNLNANAGYFHATGFLRQNLVRDTRDMQTDIITSDVILYSFLKETFEDYTLKLTGDYALSEKVSIGANVQGIYHPNKERDLTEQVIKDYINANTVRNLAVNDRGFWRSNLNTNVNLKYIPAKEHEISFDADMLSMDSRNEQYLVSMDFDESGNKLPSGLELKSDLPNDIDVYVAKADYAGTIEKIKLEAGVKTSFINNTNGSFNEVKQNDNWVYDSLRSNNYIYKEDINAAYVSASKNITEKLQGQVGVRLENTNISGVQETTGSEFDRNFTNIFPTGFVSYKVDEKNSFELNYGKRINRPTYRDLNPFVFYLSQYNYSSGNPDLLPQIRHNLELKHNYSNVLFTSVSMGKRYNGIDPVIIYDAVTKAVYTTLQNRTNKDVLHFSTNFNKEIVPWWTLAAGFDYYYQYYEDFNGNSIASSHGASLAISNQFNLKAGWSIDTLYAFNSGDMQSVSERNGPNHWMNAGVAKKIWKDTATIKLSVEDPFAIYRYTPSRDWAGVRISGDMQYATQQVSLGFTYNFGKKIEQMQQRNSAGEESKRM